MPREMAAPSKTGPAAVEQHSRRPSCHRASSPLVPISASRALSARVQIWLATRAEVMSAPTKADMHRGRYSLAPGAAESVSSSGSAYRPNSSSARKGAWDRQSTSRPVSRYSMVVLPVRTPVSTAAASIPAWVSICRSRASTPSRMHLARASRPPARDFSMREMTSAPYTRWGLGAADWARRVPLRS